MLFRYILVVAGVLIISGFSACGIERKLHLTFNDDLPLTESNQNSLMTIMGDACKSINYRGRVESRAYIPKILYFCVSPNPAYYTYYNLSVDEESKRYVITFAHNDVKRSFPSALCNALSYIEQALALDPILNVPIEFGFERLKADHYCPNRE